MQQIPFELISAVQDLQALLQRVVPGEQHSRVGRAGDRERVWQLFKGAECLLSNSQPVSAVCLMGQCWGLFKEGAWRAAGLSEEPEYFRYISYELLSYGSSSMVDAYRLYGEVASLYLDMLIKSGETGDVRPDEVAQSRARLIKAAQD